MSFRAREAPRHYGARVARMTMPSHAMHPVVLSAAFRSAQHGEPLWPACVCGSVSARVPSEPQKLRVQQTGCGNGRTHLLRPTQSWDRQRQPPRSNRSILGCGRGGAPRCESTQTDSAPEYQAQNLTVHGRRGPDSTWKKRGRAEACIFRIEKSVCKLLVQVILRCRSVIGQSQIQPW
jgi:hypothetical protein